MNDREIRSSARTRVLHSAIMIQYLSSQRCWLLSAARADLSLTRISYRNIGSSTQIPDGMLYGPLRLYLGFVGSSCAQKSHQFRPSRDLVCADSMQHIIPVPVFEHIPNIYYSHTFLKSAYNIAVPLTLKMVTVI